MPSGNSAISNSNGSRRDLLIAPPLRKFCFISCTPFASDDDLHGAFPLRAGLGFYLLAHFPSWPGKSKQAWRHLIRDWVNPPAMVQSVVKKKMLLSPDRPCTIQGAAVTGEEY